jgi:ABC-type polysaccharide/polyol phosphate transport system ATPase subunit
MMGASNGYNGAAQAEVHNGKVVLTVDGLYKKFCRNLKRSMIYGLKDLARGLVGLRPHTGALRQDEFWALENLSFDLKEGEILGIIGANGSGKSTLLRILTGIYPPDRGRVWMDGKVGGIIALGAGMHPHMTGRENIFLNATILGMSRSEIETHFDSIVAFAELGEFLDAPLSTYSSGMKVRLGFAVAIHCKPDILLIDEVLAVGDARFRNKCLAALAEYRRQAKAIIYISHDLDQIRNLCSRVMVLEHGKCIYLGPVGDGLTVYERSIYGGGKTQLDPQPLDDFSDVISKMKMKATQVALQHARPVFNLDFQFHSEAEADVAAIVIVTKAGDRYPLIYEEVPFHMNRGFNAMQGTIKSDLKTGSYDVYFHIRDEVQRNVYSQYRLPGGLQITSNKQHSWGVINVQATWSFAYEQSLQSV